MPRLNRRPLRGSVTQHTQGTTMRLRAQPTTPRGFAIRLAILIGGVMCALIFFLWSWHNGWPGRVINGTGSLMMEVSRDIRLAVRDVVVIGRTQTSKDEIAAALNARQGTAILAFDPDEAQARVARLPWVADAVVERHLPDTILVKITERVPMARWQNNNKTVVIDKSGKVLSDASADKFSTLPLVVGAGANDHTDSLLSALQAYPTVMKNVTAASRVGGRRWDFYLQPKTVAKMPEGDMSEALQRLTDLINEKKILERDMVSVDLRLPDRMVLEPGSSAPNRSAGSARP